MMSTTEIYIRDIINDALRLADLEVTSVFTQDQKIVITLEKVEVE